MAGWSLKTYNGKDIKTKEDIIWVCKEVHKAYRGGNPKMKDMMALSFLKDLYNKHGEIEIFEPIENRFEILDL